MTDLEKLRSFAQAVMASWPNGDVDGGLLQEAALEFGLLREETVAAPCGPGCSCHEYYMPEDWPVQCLRRTALLLGRKKKE